MSRWPSPRLTDRIGISANAFTPIPAARSSARSRTAPSTTMPAQPFFAAAAARLPPTSALRTEPPPSTTSTRPSPAELTASRMRELSSIARTVATGPQNLPDAPKSRNTGGRTRKAPDVSSSWASQRSQVAKAVEVIFR
jgi:hypothetical protein